MKQSLNIGFALGKYPSGGTEVVVRHVTTYLKGHGHSIFIFAGDCDREALLSDFGNDITLVEYPKGRNSLKRKKTAISIGKMLREFHIDFFVVSGVSKFHFREVKQIAPNTKLIFSHHSMPFWEIVIRIGRKWKKNRQPWNPAVLISRTSLYKKWLNYSYTKRYRSIYDAVEGYTVLCESYKEETLSALGIASGKKSKIFTQVNPSIAPEGVSLEKSKTVVYLGRITYSDKRTDRLVHIWKRVCEKHSDWTLKIVGEGPEKPSLLRVASDLGLKNIEFHPFTSNVAQYYDEAAILCLVSEFEGWPMVLVEAQNHGVVPIAYACSAGVRELLSPAGVNGILVEPFDQDEYAAKLSELMSNPELRAGIQGNIVTKNGEYTPEKIGERWERMFYEILNRENQNA